MRIAVVDDRAADRAELIGLLGRYCTARSLHAEHSSYASADSFLADFCPGRYDLVFLDIYMNGTGGMEAARRLLAQDPACRFIFCTTSHEHAVESYSVRASFYLTKPLDESLFNQAMDLVCGDLARDSRAVTVRCGGVDVVLLMRDILYMDCSLEHVRLHLEERLLTVDNRAGELSSRLCADSRFLCCNRNIIVNMDWIASVDSGDFLLKNGLRVPIRQRGCSAVKKAYLRYSLQALEEESMP